MAEYIVQSETLTALADVVRKKANIEKKMTLEEMIATIKSFDVDTELTIFFYDYDGTELYAYSVKDAIALTSLPSAPAHDGLTFDGWTSTVEEVNSSVRLKVDALYRTDITTLLIELTDEALAITLQIVASSSPYQIVVDWGDGTQSNLTAYSSNYYALTPTHTYTLAGKYTISITGDFDSGTATSSYTTILKENTLLKEARFGNNCEDVARACWGCLNLEKIVFSSSVNFYSLSSRFGTCCACYSLKHAVLPEGTKRIHISMFEDCVLLTHLIVPDSVSVIDENAFYGCTSMKEYYIKPTTPPTLEDNVFFGIPSDCTIYVPRGCLEAYQTATGWSTYADHMKEF